MFKGKGKTDPELEVAAKCFNKALLTQKDIEVIRAETDRLVELSHPNIVKYFEWFEDKKYIYSVSKFIEGQTFQQMVEKGRKDFAEGDIATIMKQLYDAVAYLKQNNVIHMNIVPNNVMIDDSLHVTLIDIGLARLTERGKHVNAVDDISQFTAPESYDGEFSASSDVWSLGNLAYLLFAGKLPFSGDNVMGTFKKSTMRNLTFKSSVWSDVTKEGKNMIKHMLAGDPDKRISIEDLTHHRWLEVAEDIVHEQEEEIIDEKILQKLLDFQFKNKLQNIFVHMQVNMIMNNEEFPEFTKQFNLIDKDQDGVISQKELKNALKGSTKTMESGTEKDIIKTLDFSDKKQINFTEFLIPIMNRAKIKDEKAIKDLFAYFDTDKDNLITQDDILREIQ